ncbi:MAG: rhomboid family intramembrane serine protease [Anaerolineales bacterium]|nr:rhomboid family intramembrane serine protease [Anaerolineales bacterium]
MFPLRDTIRAKSFPGITYGLIGINVLVFLLESRIGEHALTTWLSTFALMPARLSLANPASWLTLITSTFLHGSWFHLLSNIWMLHIFGDNVEDRMGSGRYLAFYLLAGVVSGLAHALFSAYGNLPTIGASGAIAGVMGAYILFYPRGRVVTFIPGLFFLPWVIEVQAALFLGIWFLLQLSNGLMSIGMVDVAQFSGVAWWAHIGGFVFGMIGTKIFAGGKGSDPEPMIFSF